MSDGCGNVTRCEQLITIIDCKPPTPYCHTGLSTSISSSDEGVTIWAVDFDNGSWDECSGPVDFSIGEDRDSIGITVTCADLGGEDRIVIDIPLYVWDTEGNFDVCNTQLVVSDNKSACTDEEAMVTVSGIVRTESEVGIELVEVQLMEGDNMMGADLSTFDGSYMIPDVGMDGEYMLELSKEDDPLNGVSTLDIVILQQHILGINKLPSPYQYIAGDVNDNQKLTATDIIEMRRLILGIDKEWRRNEEWRFVPKSDYGIDEIMYVEKDHEDLNAINGDMVKDFVGIKIGDLSGNVDAHQVRKPTSRTSTVGYIDYNYSESDVDKMSISFYVTVDQDLEGIQFEMVSDDKNFNIDKINTDNGMLDQDEVYFNGESISVSGSRKISKGERIKLFEVEVIPRGNKYREKSFSLIRNRIEPEWYDNQLKSQPLILRSSEIEDPQVKLSSVNPNPFTDFTQLLVYSDSDRSIQLLINDLSGKTLRSVNYQLSKGLNQMVLQRNNLESGIYIIRSNRWPQLNHKILIVD